jgi:aldehyde dehydrogenase (NAD+)
VVGARRERDGDDGLPLTQSATRRCAVRAHDKLFIGGEWVAPATSELIEVVSPHTEEVVATVPNASTTDIDRAVAAARDAFDNGEWPRRSPTERTAAVQRFSDIYASRLGDMAEVITTEMGSPITFSNLAQSPAPWMMLTSFITVAQQYPWEDIRQGVLGTDVIVRSEPVGVVAAIVPWNVPQFVTMSKLAPALLAGCTIVIKPAPETPLDGFLMAEMLQEAGIPRGVVSVVPAGREVGEHLVRHPGVDKVAFTGSTAAGRRIASICGEQLKRVSLELGGKSAAIVLDDADLAATIEGLKFASLMNNGQACVAQTRILASRQRYDDVVDALSSMVASLNVGDPSDPATEVGPLVAKRQQERVEKYIALGQEEGARVVVGGNGLPSGVERGWYVQPTVFANASNDMRISREEIFGPVLSVIPFDDVDDAVRIANDSEYGLAGSVWTSDIDQGMDIARRVRTGTYGVNQYTMDFVAPFGGFKGSGVGREFGKEGLEHYIELKSIVPPGGGVAAAG